MPEVPFGQPMAPKASELIAKADKQDANTRSIHSLSELRGSSSSANEQITDAVNVIDTQQSRFGEVNVGSSWSIDETMDSVFQNARLGMSLPLSLFESVSDEELKQEAVARLDKNQIFQVFEKSYLSRYFSGASNISSSESENHQQRGWRVRTFENISDAELEQEIEKRLTRGVEFRRLAAWFSQRHPRIVPDKEGASSSSEIRTLTPDELEAVRRHAAARPWLSRRKFGYPWRMSPFLFIQEEYTMWLSKGLTRAQLRRADEDLMIRFDKWILEPGNAVPAGFLPDRSEASDIAAGKLAELSPESIKEAGRLARRETVRAWRKKQRNLE